MAQETKHRASKIFVFFVLVVVQFVNFKDANSVRYLHFPVEANFAISRIVNDSLDKDASVPSTESQVSSSSALTNQDTTDNTTLAKSNAPSTPLLVAESSVCQWLNQNSPMALWHKNLGGLLAASRTPLDRQYKLHDITAYVLQVMTPRLALAQRSLPRQSVAPLLRKVQARWDFLQLQKQEPKATRKLFDDSTAPRPIRIVVLGGSVTFGMNCKTGIHRNNRRSCSWPARLENLLNQMAAGTMVEIVNMAAGGSNTAIGKEMMEYDILPPESQDADIIVNAYATNDMHVLTMNEAKNNGVSLREKTFDMAQDFARAVMGKCPEKRPLLLWLDDYLGNEQRGILETTELSQGLQVLANYYGFGLISYADTVRDLVYGTTHETIFSPGGWYEEGQREMVREIHPSASMHIAVSYIMTFYMLQMSSIACATDEEWRSVTHYTGGHGLPEAKDKNAAIQGRPRPAPETLPPPLNSGLHLDNVTKQWRDAEPLPVCSKIIQRRCPITWLSTVLGIDVMKDMEPYFKKPMEWSFREDHGKYGFFPNNNSSTTGGDVMEMQFDLDQDIRMVQVFFLKSYGERWANSAVDVQIVAENQIVTRMKLVGFHDKETSETYSEGVQFPKVLRKFHVRFVHVAGQTFKVLGFAVCS